jgi:hypothetical protein
MSVTVRNGSAGRIAVSQGQKTSASIVVKKATDVTLQSLNNVVATDLQDGYTLVYDEELNKWVAQPLGNVKINAVDGGTF